MDSVHEGSEAPVMLLQRRMAAALRKPEPDEFVGLCHPEIEFQTYGLGSRELHGTAEILEWWRTMRDATAYKVSLSEVTPLAERVVFIEGRIQFEREGWFTDRQAHWVLIERDDLAWRYRPVEDLGGGSRVCPVGGRAGYLTSTSRCLRWRRGGCRLTALRYHGSRQGV